MSDFLLYASVVALFLVCILVVLVILMQRPSANAGMGSALGGGAAETVFGGESANVLSKMTTTLTVILFVLSFGLYLGFVAREKPSAKALDAKATAPSPLRLLRLLRLPLRPPLLPSLLLPSLLLPPPRPSPPRLRPRRLRRSPPLRLRPRPPRPRCPLSSSTARPTASSTSSWWTPMAACCCKARVLTHPRTQARPSPACSAKGWAHWRGSGRLWMAWQMPMWQRHWRRWPRMQRLRPEHLAHTNAIYLIA